MRWSLTHIVTGLLPGPLAKKDLIFHRVHRQFPPRRTARLLSAILYLRTGLHLLLHPSEPVRQSAMEGVVRVRSKMQKKAMERAMWLYSWMRRGRVDYVDFSICML
jgi:hypothetical protein